MSRKPGVRIYENGQFHHFEKPHVARQMEEAGMLQAMYEQRTTGPNFIGYQIRAAIASDSNHTPCSLTKSDSLMLATGGKSLTAGLSDDRRHRIDLARAAQGKGPLPEVDRQEIVQARVAFYPHEFDKRAPSIFNCQQRSGRTFVVTK